MTRLLRMVAAALAALLVTIAAALAFGAWRWARDDDDVARRLLEGGATPAAYDTTELAGLPAPVQRYFRRVLAHGQAHVVRARLVQTGSFLVRETPKTWAPFRATETFRVRPPAFVWRASMPMAPGMTAFVRDRYLDGRGAMRVELAKVVPIVDQRDTPEMASGALVRYLAEAPWFPTALLPSAGVRWEGLDDSTARATLTDAGVSVSMDFVFAPGGEITRGYTMSRARVDARGVRYLPWGGRYAGWTRHGGLLVPTTAEVAWQVDGRWEPYWIGRVDSVVYEWAR